MCLPVLKTAHNNKESGHRQEKTKAEHSSPSFSGQLLSSLSENM